MRHYQKRVAPALYIIKQTSSHTSERTDTNTPTTTHSTHPRQDTKVPGTDTPLGRQPSKLATWSHRGGVRRTMTKQGLQDGASQKGTTTDSRHRPIQQDSPVRTALAIRPQRPVLPLQLASYYLEEEREMQHSSVSISLSF